MSPSLRHNYNKKEESRRKQSRSFSLRTVVRAKRRKTKGKTHALYLRRENVMRESVTTLMPGPRFHRPRILSLSCPPCWLYRCGRFDSRPHTTPSSPMITGRGEAEANMFLHKCHIETKSRPMVWACGCTSSGTLRCDPGLMSALVYVSYCNVRADLRIVPVMIFF